MAEHPTLPSHEQRVKRIFQKPLASEGEPHFFAPKVAGAESPSNQGCRTEKCSDGIGSGSSQAGSHRMGLL
jgi:hypothetical protein